MDDVAFGAWLSRQLTIRAGRPALLVTFTVPDQIEDGHVEFAWRLADSSRAYAVEINRRHLGLPPARARKKVAA